MKAMEGGLTALAAAASLAALSVALPDSWAEANGDGIRFAAVEALLSHPDGPRRHPELVACVTVWTGPDAMGGGGEEQDPSPSLLHLLQAIRSGVRPWSECEGTEGGVRHRPSGSPAVLLRVAAPRRSADDFCRIEAEWFYDGLSSVGWRYTVSRDKGKWIVDTEKLLWIS